MSDTVKLGQLITGDGPRLRDAVRVAVIPVTAGEKLLPGQKIGVIVGRIAVANTSHIVGIVDPLLESIVEVDQEFLLWLLPNTVTGMRHSWTHPSFDDDAEKAATMPGDRKSESLKWMQAWAIEHTPGNYYEDEDSHVDPEKALKLAIDAGREIHIGPYEPARDYIDNKWWDHWENITGEKAGDRRGGYFSCSC